MSKQRDDRILVRDDSDLFRLVRRLTEEQPPTEARDLERGTESVIQVELPFSVLLDIVDRLTEDKAVLLYHRLENRLDRTTMSAS